jgi:hypothetical protein
MAIPRNLANIAPHVNASSTELVVNDGGANLDFRVEGDTDANTLFVDAGNNRVGVSTNAPSGRLDVSYGADTNIPAILFGADAGSFGNTTRTDATGKFGTIGGVPYTNADGFYNVIGCNSSSGVNGVNIGGSTSGLKGATQIVFATAADTTSTGTERARITSAGVLMVGTTVINPGFSNSSKGINLYGPDGYIMCSREAGEALFVNRSTNDGAMVSLRQEGTEEGNISVSGSTVSYNGGHLSRWAQMFTKPELVKGTVMSNLDEMNVYIAPTTYWTEEDELPEGVNVGDVKVETHEVQNER